jgi:hypothetical protein
MDFFIALLPILLIGLKLTDKIDWTWGKIIGVSLLPLAFLFLVGVLLGIAASGL